MFKVDLEKAEEPEIKLPTFVGSSQKQESSRKHLLYWLHQSLWLCWSQQTVENSSRVRNTRPPYLPPEKSVFLCLTQVKKQQLELDMEQQTGSKLENEYVKAVYCHPSYLTYMQSTSWETGLDEAQGGIKIAGRNINNLSYVDDTTLIAENEEELKIHIDESERGVWKSWLKAQHSEN